jgi:hypothetical protein
MQPNELPQGMNQTVILAAAAAIPVGGGFHVSRVFGVSETTCFLVLPLFGCLFILKEIMGRREGEGAQFWEIFPIFIYNTSKSMR